MRKDYDDIDDFIKEIRWYFHEIQKLDLIKHSEGTQTPLSSFEFEFSRVTKTPHRSDLDKALAISQAIEVLIHSLGAVVIPVKPEDFNRFVELNGNILEKVKSFCEQLQTAQPPREIPIRSENPIAAQLDRASETPPMRGPRRRLIFEDYFTRDDLFGVLSRSKMLLKEAVKNHDDAILGLENNFVTNLERAAQSIELLNVDKAMLTAILVLVRMRNLYEDSNAELDAYLKKCLVGLKKYSLIDSDEASSLEKFIYTKGITDRAQIAVLSLPNEVEFSVTLLLDAYQTINRLAVLSVEDKEQFESKLNALESLHLYNIKIPSEEYIPAVAKRVAAQSRYLDKDSVAIEMKEFNVVPLDDSTQAPLWGGEENVEVLIELIQQARLTGDEKKVKNLIKVAERNFFEGSLEMVSIISIFDLPPPVKADESVAAEEGASFYSTPSPYHTFSAAPAATLSYTDADLASGSSNSRSGPSSPRPGSRPGDVA